jgi:hypothetical protein
VIGRVPAFTATRRRALRDAAVLAGLIVGGYVLFIAAPQKGTLAVDALAYWRVDLSQLYVPTTEVDWAFNYAPPIAALLYPFTQLPWLGFAAGWYALLMVSVAWLGQRSFLVVLAFVPVAVNLSDGNIHLLLAVAIVLGFRYPAMWSFVLLTKATPGIGLLWFVARREWRPLTIALGATAAIAAVSLVFLPGQWIAYVDMLLGRSGAAPPWPALPIPLWVRLPIAAAVIWWGALRDARWTVPLGAMLALPWLWPGGFAMLAAWWRLPLHKTDASEPAPALETAPVRRAQWTRDRRGTKATPAAGATRSGSSIRG